MNVFYYVIPILFIFSLGCVAPQSELSSYINENHLDAQVDERVDLVYIALNWEGSDADMIEHMIQLSKIANIEFDKPVEVDVYRGGQPYYSLYYDGNPQFKDVRSPEWRILDEISALDFLGTLSVDEDRVVFTGEYAGGDEEFTTDLLSAALISVEYAPWVNSVVFNIGPFTFVISKNDLLDYFQGNIDDQALVDRIQLSISEDLVHVDTGDMLDDTQEGCDDKDYAYKQFVKYYTEVTTMMHDQNEGKTIDQQKLNESYEKYLYWKSCYDQFQ